jgi:uncharacterized protein Yka (UPF0111/DUF47 family)
MKTLDKIDNFLVEGKMEDRDRKDIIKLTKTIDKSINKFINIASKYGSIDEFVMEELIDDLRKMKSDLYEIEGDTISLIEQMEDLI